MNPIKELLRYYHEAFNLGKLVTGVIDWYLLSSIGWLIIVSSNQAHGKRVKPCAKAQLGRLYVTLCQVSMHHHSEDSHILSEIFDRKTCQPLPHLPVPLNWGPKADCPAVVSVPRFGYTVTSLDCLPRRDKQAACS